MRKKEVKRAIFFVLIVAMLVLVGVKNSSATECGSVPTNGCSVSQNTTFVTGIYSLMNGINIGADNIILDCNGSIINGSSRSPYTYGIQMNGYYYHNAITNCTVMNYDGGLFLRGGDYGGPTSNRVFRNTFKSNNNGIYLLTRVRYNNITQNRIQDNFQKGINLDFSIGVEKNKIWNNDFLNNTLQAYDSGYGGTINYWNSSGQGNYWSNYDNETKGCYDNNSDLSCDAPYNISGSAVSKDYLSLIGVKVINILPIQVVKDIDMVKGKTTLVRSTLENVGIVNKNITVKLYFEGSLMDTKDDAINSGQSKYVDLFFSPNISGDNKQIKIEVKENK